MLCKRQLSEPRKKFLELLQRLNFGEIRNLRIEQGDPQFDGDLHIIQDIKFGAGENGPRPECHIPDFTLKAQLHDLFQEFDTDWNWRD